MLPVLISMPSMYKTVLPSVRLYFFCTVLVTLLRNLKTKWARHTMFQQGVSWDNLQDNLVAPCHTLKSPSWFTNVTGYMNTGRTPDILSWGNIALETGEIWDSTSPFLYC